MLLDLTDRLDKLVEELQVYDHIKRTVFDERYNFTAVEDIKVKFQARLQLWHFVSVSNTTIDEWNKTIIRYVLCLIFLTLLS